MIGTVTSMPSILSPGRGPNGPGPIDMRAPISSVGNTSPIPYGPTNGYTNPNGVTGFCGPTADALRRSTNWYVRTAGSNNNGGSSSSTSAERSGTDGSTTANNSTFTSASAAFTQADVGKGICIQNATFCYAKIIQINSATSVQLSNPPSASASSLSWSIGGAWADLRPFLNCSAFALTTCGVQAGDNVYVGGGTYRQLYGVGNNFGVAWNATAATVIRTHANFCGLVNIIADVYGKYTGDSGMVALSGYLTNDRTVPTATTVLQLNGAGNLVFRNFVFIGGTGNPTLVAGGTSKNVQNDAFYDCAFLNVTANNTSSITISTIGFMQQLLQQNLLFDRCYFLRCTISLTLSPFSASSPDTDMNITFRNFIMNGGTLTATCGANGHIGGVRIKNLTGYNLAGNGIAVTGAAGSTVFPMTLYNSLLFNVAGTTLLNAAVSGQIIEDYNILVALTPRTLVSTGAHSISDYSYNPLIHLGFERIYGALARQWGEPMPSSPVLGFGSDGTQLLVDIMNNPRPAGGGSGLPAVGAFERSNTAAQVSSPAPPSGTYDWQFTGPGYEDFFVPVSAISNTISIQVQRDSTYSTRPGIDSNPTLEILANDAIGVTGQVIADTGSSGGWNTLTAGAFTPTATGWVKIRIRSSDQSGGSLVQFANFSIT